MKMHFRLSFTFLTCACLNAALSQAQSLSVGTPVLEDAYRRAQLLGQVDSSVAFTSRPIFPSLLGTKGYYFDATGSLQKGREKQQVGCFEFAGDKGVIKLLPVI